jgi:competence protein ComEC
MMAGLAAAAVSWFWRCSFIGRRFRLPLLLPSRKAAAIAGMLAALAYVLLAGFGVPAQRTLYMLCVVAVAAWLDRLAGISHVLALAAAVVVLADPVGRDVARFLALLRRGGRHPLCLGGQDCGA